MARREGSGSRDASSEQGTRSERAAPARRPTMIDVANEARVSQTTVSLVLNNADGAHLSAETRARVVKAAAKLGYEPGRRRSVPNPSSAAMIGFICEELTTDPWTSIGYDGVREKAWEFGVIVSVVATHGDAEMERAALIRLGSQPLLGLIYATINTRLIHAPLTLPRTPTVLLNCRLANCALPSVVPGDLAGGSAATDFLIRAGHRRIGYINGESRMVCARSRLKGYRKALAVAGLPFDPDLVREGNWQPLSGYECTRELMRLTSPPSAIFCGNDMMAVGCYDALRELGMKIPEDVAVMGYDDREIAQHLRPSLTTVLLPHFEMGTIAAAVLLETTTRPSDGPEQITVECPIVKRMSV